MNFAMVVVSLMLACLLTVSVAEPAVPGPDAGAGRLAQAQNAFATDLYAQLQQYSGNLFFSPHSIATALSMTFVGAQGDTAAEMAKLLRLGFLGSGEQVTAVGLQPLVLVSYASQQKVFKDSQKDGIELCSANALWGKVSYPFNPEYIARIQESFAGHLEPVDFRNEAAASQKINDWVSDQTREKVRNLIGPGMLTPDTRLVLTNAIYFKAAWDEPFRKEATSKERFHVSASKDVEVDMMKQTRFFDLAQLDGFKLLMIPYRNHEASMLVLLPDRVDGLAELEKALTADQLTAWLERRQSVRVALSLPKFKTTGKFDLNTPLMTLGMKAAFMAGQADFTGIAKVPSEPLYIGAVLHQAFVDVNEAGTEAAAATAVVMRAGSAMRPAEPIPFVADHPFIYIIRANRGGEILFMGRLSDPSEPGA